MSLESVISFARTRTKTGASLSEVYGTEHFGIFLYSYIRMVRPSVVVELGVGTATTTCFIAQALADNGVGRLWCVDNGSDWLNRGLGNRMREALDNAKDLESYEDYVREALRVHGLQNNAEFVQKELASGDYFDPGVQIDILFADATPSDAEGCLDLLRYYLPKMSDFSSIFIDKASTINHSYLLLEYICRDLSQGRVPLHLLTELDQQSQRRMQTLARISRFHLVHLTESDPAKKNPAQNSRAWLRMEPLDIMPHNSTRSYF